MTWEQITDLLWLAVIVLAIANAIAEVRLRYHRRRLRQATERRNQIM
jgi:hypothetical protein